MTLFSTLEQTSEIPTFFSRRSQVCGISCQWSSVFVKHYKHLWQKNRAITIYCLLCSFVNDAQSSSRGTLEIAAQTMGTMWLRDPVYIIGSMFSYEN